MMVHPWDAASNDEWRAWLATGRDFGQLVVNDPAGWPAVVPTHFTVDDERTVLVHLARPNPVWRLIEAQPRVVLAVVDDDAYIPNTWRAAPNGPAREGVPTSYYAAVHLRCRAEIVDDPADKAELLRRQLRFLQPGARPRAGRRRRTAVRAAAARHPWASPARRRRPGQVQVRRPQERRASSGRRRPAAAARSGSRRWRSRAAAAPPAHVPDRADVTAVNPSGSPVMIRRLPEHLYSDAVALWQQTGLTRPWNDPTADLRLAMTGSASTVLAAIERDALLATAMVGHDGHRGWVYYLAVTPAQQGRGLGRRMVQACEEWVRARGVPKIQLMVRTDNAPVAAFYERLGYADAQVVVLGRRLDGVAL